MAARKPENIQNILCALLFAPRRHLVKGLNKSDFDSKHRNFNLNEL